MAAKFYTDAELKTARDKAVEIVAEGVASFYSDVGVQFGRVLFFTCMRLWKSGPAVTCARLNSNIRPQIINAWRWNEKLVGVLLKRNGFEFTPFFLQTRELAPLLTTEADLWIDFEEVRKELGYDT